jgi:hypothetical protein
MHISTQQPQVGLRTPAKIHVQETQEQVDQFEPGAFKKGLHAAAGALGSVVGGTLGIVPGVGLGTRRMLSISDNRPSLRDHMAACDAGDMWGISYGLLGVGIALTASAVLNTTPLQNVAMLALAVPAAMAPQSIFRMISSSTARAPQADTYFPSNVAYCADAHMSAETTNPINGAMSGIRHGARQGKLALQDLLVPSMKPNDSTYYGQD